MNKNIRTMKLLGEDGFGCPVYKCVETGKLWKDINMGEGTPELYSCQNSFDGEPEYPINSNLEIRYIGVKNEPTMEEKFSYQMMSRLKSDCDYYLGCGNRHKKDLYYHDEQKHIEKMKKLHNSFPDDKKPEWLTWEEILEYEKLMTNETTNE